MTETATSPRYHPPTRTPRPTATPSARPSNFPGSVGQNMPPFASNRLSTPHNPSVPNVSTPSPNYFGFQASDSSSFLTDAPQHSKTNWSPPSSTVRSTAAASPSVLPLDQNPEFDAFRRQSEGKAFNLGGLGSNFSMSAPPSAPPKKAKHGRSSSRQEAQKDLLQQAQSKSLDPGAAELGRSPKRVLSPGSMILPEEARRASPASFAHTEPERRSRDSALDSQPRFALPLGLLTGRQVLRFKMVSFSQHGSPIHPAIWDSPDHRLRS